MSKVRKLLAILGVFITGGLGLTLVNLAPESAEATRTVN
jgi:hypothetical protein